MDSYMKLISEDTPQSSSARKSTFLNKYANIGSESEGTGDIPRQMRNIDIHELLSQQTPKYSGATRSSFIKKCISFGSEKKALSFDVSNLEGSMNQTSTSFANQGNLEVSNVNYNLEDTRFQNSYLPDSSRFMNSPMSQVDYTNVTRGEFDTTVLIDANTGAFIAESLHDEFLEFFLSYSGEHEIFNLLLNYEELCCKSFEAISKSIGKNFATDVNLQKITKMIENLQMERNTWRLLRILFQDRIDSEENENGEMLDFSKPYSDKDLIDYFYQNKPFVRQIQLIIDWLEKNADEDYQLTFFDKFEHFTDKCMALEHSLNELTTANFGQRQRGNIQLDPDACFREGCNPLHEGDRENELRLFKFMFICIRAGKLDKAQQLAERFGMPWLAATLEGWRLYHDPNFSTDIMDGQELLPVEGNMQRELWKVTCWETSQTPIVPDHERALYASFCGNLKGMLAVCKTWEDYLWAYAKATLDKMIENEIRCHSSVRREDSVKIPAEYWDKILDFEEIFKELEASDSSEVRSKAKTPYHVIQKYIVLDDIDGLIQEMYSWLTNQVLNGDILRCMAHIILFLRVIGRSTLEDLCIPILESYVDELIKAHKVALVAPYTSTLPKKNQIWWYAKFLENITDNEERQKCLQYAEDAGLDVPEITKAVVKNIREKGSGLSEPTTDLSVVTTNDDYRKIHAIDWLIFNPTQRAEAVKQANALMRVFVVQRKMEAAKLLFNKIPEDSVAVMMELSKANGLEELSAEDDNTTREYLCFKAYLEAMDAFNTWFHQSIHAKPVEPLPPTGDHVTFKEKVAHEHEVQQYEKDLERWKRVVAVHADTASECLYNVLLFVNGGWMIDQRIDGVPNEARQKELSSLRKMCIPHVTRLFQDLLFTEERFKEAIQLSDVIASEQYQLYKEFTNEDLEQFLGTTLDSSFALLDKNMDPLGFTCQ